MFVFSTHRLPIIDIKQVLSSCDERSSQTVATFPARKEKSAVVYEKEQEDKSVDVDDEEVGELEVSSLASFLQCCDTGHL